LPGIDLPYHQDEWKNIASSATADNAGTFFAHPPLMQIAFVASYNIFGEDYSRLFPLFFSILTGILIFIVVKKRLGQDSAFWSLGLFTLCFYSILGSLQPDVDGSIIPLFLLTSIYAYDKWCDSETNQSKRKWLLFLTCSLLIGFLFKLSFVIVIGALVVDYIWTNRKSFTLKKSFLGIVFLSCFSLVYIALLYFIQFIYPAFSISFMLGHANQFTEELSRNYTQIIVQGVKAVFYLSPLLLVPLLYVSKELFRKNRIFFIYLILGFIFYFIIFDFSRGALDKYLMFAIVPLAVIIGTIISDTLNRINSKVALLQDEMKWPILIGIFISVILFILNFLPHEVLSLYPKTEWFSSVFHLRWNILNPFNGGSGPAGFYVSFMFIAVAYLVSLVAIIIGFLKKQWRAGMIVIVIIISLVYNFVMTEELLFGRINGNVAEVIHKTVNYLQENNSVKNVLTYNDIGSHEFSNEGKYAGRFYATPDFEEGHKKKFMDYDYYVVIDIPHLYENGFYGKFFDKCHVLFETLSGRIDGKVYDCKEAKKYIKDL
jgi:4-amino-4-deoxy-L-arabinose transferase-like glycosyltransferase